MVSTDTARDTKAIRVVANLTGKPTFERELFGANMASLSQQPRESRDLVRVYCVESDATMLIANLQDDPLGVAAELRRRLFWLLFGAERASACVHDNACLLSDDTDHVQDCEM